MSVFITAPDGAFHNHGEMMMLGNHIQGEQVNIGLGLSVLAERARQLDKLPYAATATFNHYSRETHSFCMPHTREQVLHDVMTWARGEPGDGPHIYWLNGMAGTGKSTIARTIASCCFDEGRLGASFFFSRGGGELETARMLVTTIAVQLAQLSPAHKELIADAIMKHPHVVHQTLGDQWKKLVLTPLEILRAAGKLQSLAAVVIVIDALDECSDGHEIEFLLQLLSETPSLIAAQLRIFLTSRPEILIRDGYLDLPASERRHLTLHHIEPSVVDQDIRVFFERKLGRMLQKHQSSPNSFEHDLQKLVEKAGGLFIWAATACRFVLQGGPRARKRLDTVLFDRVSTARTTPEQKLDEIYSSVLQNALRPEYSEEEAAEVCSSLRTVLGTIAVLVSALSAPALEALLGLPKNEVSDILGDLHAIFDVPEDPNRPIRPQHASVRDYLLSGRRCIDTRFLVSEQGAHAHIAHQRIRLMNNSLHQNICNLDMNVSQANDAGLSLVASKIAPPLRYACLYWVLHVGRSRNAQEWKDMIHNFLLDHFLHWLEALSLLRKLDDGIEILRDLQSMFPDDKSLLKALAADVRQFLIRNGTVIHETPLQVYTSALIFAPKKSTIRQLLSHQRPPWLPRLPATEDSWSQELQTLEDHSDSVNTVVFPPDGQILASGSADGTVKLWNARMGTGIGTLKGHFNMVRTVAFSPDGQRLASGSDDNTVRLWNAKTGTALGTLEGHSGSILSIAFSPDGKLLALASRDRTVKLWNATKGVVCSVLVGCSDWARAVAFSPDGRLLSSGMGDKTVWLWDVVAGRVSFVFEGHSAAVLSVDFSPDGQQVASASRDKTIRLWNAKTGVTSSILKGHSGWVNAVAYLRDGTILASASDDTTVKLWDPKTGAARGTLEGHTHWVRAIAFSADTGLLASASGDCTVRLWDALTVAASANLEGHSASVSTVSFSGAT